MSALLFWAMFFLIIAYGPSSLPAVARERFLDRGAQNSKIVSTSGGRSPPDPPFFERTFLRAGHSADLF